MSHSPKSKLKPFPSTFKLKYRTVTSKQMTQHNKNKKIKGKKKRFTGLMRIIFTENGHVNLLIRCTFPKIFSPVVNNNAKFSNAILYANMELKAEHL